MYILFDIGATKIRIARSSTKKVFDTPVIIDTPALFEEGMALFITTVKKLVGDERVEALAGGITGSLSQDRRTLVVSPHLPDWSGKSPALVLENAFGAPVFLENDAAIVGLGEAHTGAGKGYPILAYITVSTGVGGVRIVDGTLDRSALGFEPGQQIIDADGTLCSDCEKPATLEHYVSGTSVFKRFHKKAYEIEQSHPLWSSLADWLSVGLSNVIVTWSPDAIVLGGSMIVGDPAISITKVREGVMENVAIFKRIPEIKKAELGAIGGIHGALVYLQSKLP